MPKHKPSSSTSSQSGEPKSKKARIKSSRSDENEEGEEEEDLFNQSQNPDFTAPFEAREAEYGIIEKISVKNFICHGRLDCNFGPNVNFVVGRNGSGKSAILTAIVVGLGGKAIVTSRGNSVKNFIKAGKNVAEVCIKLRNRGDDAYLPNVYGKSITVMRRIRKDGGTTYRLMSCKGKVISTKKEELSHITDHFNIQVDNPVSIMNQETSKNFLLKQSAKDKYRFFLKATQLEQVSNDYRDIMDKKGVTEENVNAQSAKLPGLEREVLDLEQKFKALTCLHDLTNKRQELMNQSAWAQVAELEKEKDDKGSILQREENREPKFTEKILQQEVRVKEAEEKHSQIQRQGEDLRRRLEDLSPQHDVAKENVQKLKKTVKTLEREIKQLTTLIRSEESDKNDILLRIQDERERDQEQFEEERLERARQVTALMEEKRDLEAQRQNAAREIDQFANAVNGAREQNYGLQSKESEINQAISAGKRRLGNLEGSRKNRLKLYADYMPTLLEEIERCAQNRLFHEKPLGPVGTYLKLKDANWALGVEACLKRLMQSFCCHDHHDAGILKNLMNKVVPQNAFQPSIITSKFEPDRYDIRRTAVQSGEFPSFLDIVEISHPVIFNTLVDQRGVETILLIERSKDARTYLKQQPPRNCREAFTIEGDQVYAGAEQRYYSSMQKKAKILRGDTDNEIRETKKDISDNQKALNEVKQKVQRLKQVVLENENLRKGAQRQKIKLEDKMGKINNQITSLEAEGEGEDETNVADLEEEVQQMETKINEHKEKLERFTRNFKEARRQLEGAEGQFKTVDDQIQDISYQVDPLKDDLAGASIEVQTAKQNRKHYEEKKRELLKKVAHLKKEVDASQKEVEEAIVKATRIFPERLKVSRKVTNIDKEIRQINKRILKEQNMQGNPEVITKEYDDARENYTTIKKQIKGMKGFVKKLNEILHQRTVALKDMRYFIAQRTKYYFITMMSTRGYVGRLKFDHPKEELILTVDPGENQKAKDVSKDVRSLSGGERSFSTVCLIMALWESVESPFRAMDEFDVFMDMMNRKICIELMLQFAREQAIRQFIFLTPQDMSKITPTQFVHITRLHDPERNQAYITAEPTQDDSLEEEDA